MAITDQLLHKILHWIQEDTSIAPQKLRGAATLLGEGATVPFIARYRKEQTGELDEVQIRTIEERLAYYDELETRRKTVLSAIEEQGKLVPELAQAVESCRKKNELEDLYLPFKKKRRTKATMARERGLEPLAERILQAQGRAGALESLAAAFVGKNAEIPDADSALAGAGHILAERLSEEAQLRAGVRELSRRKGRLCARVAPGKSAEPTKFEMYYDHDEPLTKAPSHRVLAMLRGEAEGVLRLGIDAPQGEILQTLERSSIPKGHPFFNFLRSVAEDAYDRLIAPSIETELRAEAKERADQAAIAVFADNLRNLLLSAPAGGKRVLGVDPGLRTGSKLAAVSETGRFVAHCTIYPHTGKGRLPEAKRDLLALIREHGTEMIALGNGTASREMDQFLRETLKEAGLDIQVVMVSEAGASIYSASDIAREEFPDLDLTVRGAISIARRLQDPLAELVKLDAKSIGVGQYQHDVNQGALKKALDAVVESCVNFVGVDLNTASKPLLSFVAGIGPALAASIVTFRDEQGSFKSRKELMKVPRFGAKGFEQAAGFLRISGAKHPLDNSAVHPERYKLVETMAKDLGVSLERLVSDPALVERIDLSRYRTDAVGLPTLKDIAAELKKPGRDPRAQFEAVRFRDDVQTISDLKEGMVLQGAVSNVAAFGAFVDIGVHQDGLVHISHLANRFVKDPAEVVRVGDIVRVKVLSVDSARKRIALSIKEAESGKS